MKALRGSTGIALPFLQPRCYRSKGLDRPLGFQEVEAPEFLDSRQRKDFWYSFLLRGWVNPTTTMQPEKLSQWKIPVTPPGIKSVTFQLVAQCLNQLCLVLEAGGWLMPHTGCFTPEKETVFFSVVFKEIMQSRLRYKLHATYWSQYSMV
jgi:hypothetical protein